MSRRKIIAGTRSRRPCAASALFICWLTMLESRSGGGAIVNVSSVAAVLAGSGIAYEATKAALLGLSRSVAVRYARDGVRCNTILPGLINSTMVRREIGDREARVAPRIPLGRQGTPWEIAKAIVFLLSDDASYITGTQLIVDGGITAGEGMRR